MASQDEFDLSDVPTNFNFALDRVDKWAEDPTRRAMLWVPGDGGDPRDLTYHYFSQQSKRAAHLLTQLGAKKGDRMIIIMQRIPAWWEIVIGAIRAGIVFMPCTTLAVASDMAYRIDTSQATVFAGDEAAVRTFTSVRSKCPSIKLVLQVSGTSVDGATLYTNEMAKLLHISEFKSPDLKVSDPSLIYFTSGTTGPPKMVLHNQISYPWGLTLTGKYWLNLSPGKLYWNITEQGWAKAAWSLFGTWNTGAALFVEDLAGAFDARHVLDVLHKYPITTMCAPPTAYRQLVTQAAQKHFVANRPMALEYCCGAGEPLNAEVIRIWKEMSGGIEIKDGYGQSETITICANLANMSVKPGSMGRPTPGVTLEIVDDDGEIVKTGEEGDIAIEAVSESGQIVPFIYDGYLGKDGMLNRPFRDAKSSSRKWHSTGDRGFKDEDGYVTFVGRSDDVINSSGYRIGPFEVESVLKRHPAVLESAVVSSPDENRGEVVKAFIVLSDEAKSQDSEKLIPEIQNFCKREAAPYKYPRKIQFVDATYLPKTISGKIRRIELRQEEWKGTRRGAKL